MATQVGIGIGVANERSEEAPVETPRPVSSGDATIAREPAAEGSADDAAWDASADADTVANADIPAPAPTPPVAVPRKPPSPTRDAEQTAPQPAQSMSTAMREEVWAIVRAAVQDAIAPLVAQNKALEERLARAEKAVENERTERDRLVAAAKEAVVAAARPSGAPRGGGSIPVSLDPSIPPAALAIGTTKLPRIEERVDLTPTTPRVMPKATMPTRVPGGSLPPTGLGVVVTEGPSPTLDLSKMGGGPIEIPDFGKRRRVMGRLLVALMLLAVTAAIVMTILSHG